MFLNSQRDGVTISATDNADLRRRRVGQPLPAQSLPTTGSGPRIGITIYGWST